MSVQNVVIGLNNASSETNEGTVSNGGDFSEDAAMIQFCAMGGHDGRLRPEKKIYITLLGGCALIYPTLARRILVHREQLKNPGTRQWHFFLTIMAGVDITCPTLAEEFLDLKELMRSGTISASECDQIIPNLCRSDLSISSFTLMGGLSETGLPSEESEIDSLAMLRHVGNIQENASRVLELGIGQRDAERASTIRRAVAISP